MKHIVLDFYVNLRKGMGDSTSLAFQKVLVQGHCFVFSTSIINQFLQCSDPVGPQPIPDLRKMVSMLTYGKLSSLPTSRNLASVDLSIRYSIVHKIDIYNWLSRTHKSAITKTFATLLFVINTK